MLHTLHAENEIFYVKDTFEIFFLCEFSAILTKLTEFYYFLITLGFICLYFRLKRCFKCLVYNRGLCV